MRAQYRVEGLGLRVSEFKIGISAGSTIGEVECMLCARQKAAALGFVACSLPNLQDPYSSNLQTRSPSTDTSRHAEKVQFGTGTTSCIA